MREGRKTTLFKGLAIVTSLEIVERLKVVVFLSPSNLKFIN